MSLLTLLCQRLGRTLPTVAALLLTACTTTLSLTHLGTPGSVFTTVLLDPGHGDRDSGGTGHGLREKDLTLDTALRLRDELRRAGVRVVMTREDDHFVELADRVAFANRFVGQNTVLVSIHYNAVNNAAPHGAETFFWHAHSHGLATRLQRALTAETGLADVGVTRRRLRMTRNPEIPCVLVECAYLTNAEDARRAADPAFRQRIAHALADGLAEQRQLGDTGIPAVPELQAPLSTASDRRH